MENRMHDVRTTPDTTPTCLLSELVGQPVTMSSGESVGEVQDVVMCLREYRRPAIRGILARNSKGTTMFGNTAFATVSPVGVTLRRKAVGNVAFAPGDLEVLLREDLLGRWFTELATADLVRARDLELSETDDGWILSGVYIRPPGWFGFTRRSRTGDFRGWTALTELGKELRRPHVGSLHASDRPPARLPSCSSAVDFAGLLEAVRSGARADTAAAATALSNFRIGGALMTPWATVGTGVRHRLG
jgi:hypothetical protein